MAAGGLVERTMLADALVDGEAGAHAALEILTRLPVCMGGMRAS